MTERLILIPAVEGAIQAILWEDGRPLEWLTAGEPACHDIFLGVCSGADPALAALFVDIGAAHAALLPHNRSQPAVRAGTRMAVQVRRVSDEVGKGAVVTTKLRLPGRTVVAVPDGAAIRRRVTRAYPPAQARQWMAQEEAQLLAQWHALRSDLHAGPAPRLVWSFGDPLSVAIREWGQAVIWVEGLTRYEEVCQRAAQTAIPPRVQLWIPSAQGSMADVFGLAAAEAALRTPRVPLPSGGYLWIESTRALHTVDVNSGTARACDRETLVAQTNHEAVCATARQLRLRNLRGLLLVDLLRTQNEERARLADTFAAAASEDRGNVRVTGFTPTGLMEITRSGC